MCFIGIFKVKCDRLIKIGYGYKYYSAKGALDFIKDEEVDLAMLDIMLPDVNGFTLCQRIREKYTYPIIMLTAKDEETDKITGLTLGADD